MFHILLWLCLVSNMFVTPLEESNIVGNSNLQTASNNALLSISENLAVKLHIGAGVLLICSILYKTCINPQLSFAIGHNSIALTRRSLAFGTDVNRPYWFTATTPLHDAIDRGCFEIMCLLLREPDINVNSTDYRNNTPLDYALHPRTAHQPQNILALLCANATDYDKSSQFLTDELRMILQKFDQARHNEISFFDLVCSENVQRILYNGVTFDLIAFALRNKNHSGLEETIKNKYFDYNDIFMALAENKALAQFFSIYAEKYMNLETLKKTYLAAKKNNNKRYMNAVKNYTNYFNTLQKTKFCTQIGETMLIKKVLSYVDCSSE